MLFAFTIAKHVKSNAIVYARDGQTLGIGAGQMNRKDSARIAALRAADFGLDLKGSACASEAFFPFPDGLIQAADAGCTAVVQPGGSIGDQAVIDAADERGLAMVFTGVRTHLAVERMLGHHSGMIGLPLRLLAREVALITGEEKIVPPRPQYFVCTVEAMPLGREVDFLAIDEIQLCADPERGHVFTHRLLHARGKQETMLLGAGTMAPLVRRLLPGVEIVERERFSQLRYTGPKKLTRLPRRSAVVAFSADNVYAIAELIRRQRGGAAVVMGSLSPRTRNAQVALYQSGEVDFLVATDAIGMGLNMDVDHVAFARLRKFDGKKTRFLHPQEIGQIAGRAGRHVKDGTFGVTGEAEEMDEDLVAAVEEHAFQPVASAEWRNHRLDFTNLPSLVRSLEATPQREGLMLSAQAIDETALKRMAEDEDIVYRVRDRVALERLWAVCQTPDFRKQTSDEHLRLIRALFDNLTTGRRRLPEDWMVGQFKGLDRTDGEIDTLATRLAGVRTLAYIANRPDWLIDPAH
eukprot:gene30662-40764_t